MLGLIALAACTGNGMGLDQGGRPLPAGGGTDGPLIASFDSIQQHVFSPICTACHAGSNAPQGLHLDAGNSYSQLVGIASVEVPSLLRVNPGDPDNSYLVQKLEGHAAVGAQMPYGGAPLSAATMAVIRQWIHDGALRTVASAAPAARLAVAAAVPEVGAQLAIAPTRVVIDFSQDLDQTRVDSSTVRLEAVDAAGAAAAESIAVQVLMPRGNPRALVLQPLAPLRAMQRYRVVASGLMGVGGQPLAAADDAADGEVAITEFEVLAAP